MTDEKTERLNAVGYALFNNLAREWSLSLEESYRLLGFQDIDTFSAWKINGLDDKTNADALKMLSHLMAIYELLHQLFTVQAQANTWFLKPNQAFDGYSCLDYILQHGLVGAVQVRSYLEAQFV